MFLDVNFPCQVTIGERGSLVMSTHPMGPSHGDCTTADPYLMPHLALLGKRC